MLARSVAEQVRDDLSMWIQEVPPYNFHGSLDDSLQNLRKVVPVPPRRDYVKYMDNIGKVLRYEAQLVNIVLYVVMLIPPQTLFNCFVSNYFSM